MVPASAYPYLASLPDEVRRNEVLNTYRRYGYDPTGSQQPTTASGSGSAAVAAAAASQPTPSASQQTETQRSPLMPSPPLLVATDGLRHSEPPDSRSASLNVHSLGVLDMEEEDEEEEQGEPPRVSQPPDPSSVGSAVSPSVPRGVFYFNASSDCVLLKQLMASRPFPQLAKKGSKKRVWSEIAQRCQNVLNATITPEHAQKRTADLLRMLKNNSLDSLRDASGADAVQERKQLLSGFAKALNEERDKEQRDQNDIVGAAAQSLGQNPKRFTSHQVTQQLDRLVEAEEKASQEAHERHLLLTQQLQLDAERTRAQTRFLTILSDVLEKFSHKLT